MDFADKIAVPYGENGGWPLFHLEMLLAGHPIAVHPDQPNLINPVHEDDIIASNPGLLAAANVPATIVNWGGDQQVALEEWVVEMGRLAGIEPSFEVTEETIGGVTIDNTKRLELLGPTTVDWHDGIRRMIAAQHPELLT